LSPDLEVTVAGLIRIRNFRNFRSQLLRFQAQLQLYPLFKRLLSIASSVTAWGDILTASIITAEALALAETCAEE
jgi:hypothetical protein